MTEQGRGAAISLDDVSRHFMTDAGPVRAINGITLDIHAGSSVAVTGESGCGKSTLLSLVGALETPTAGRVTLAGQPVSELPEKRRAALRRELIGFVFQAHNLQPFLTAVENVSLQLALAGATAGYERSVELLGSLGLARAANKYPDQLSGGERQRVAVARALVHRPRLILADEPTGSLDVDSSGTVIDLLCEARSESGATLVVVTHDRDVATRLDRNVVLRDGLIVADRPGGKAALATAGG